MSFEDNLSQGLHLVKSFTLDADVRSVADVVYLPSTGGFATGHMTHEVCVWSTDGALEARLEGHTGSVVALAVLPSGRLASASFDNTARVWEAGSCVAVLRGHVRWVLTVSAHPSRDNVVATGSWDLTVRTWDVFKQTCTAVLEGYSDPLFSVRILGNADLASLSLDSCVRVWAGDDCLRTLPRGDVGAHMYSGSFALDGSYVIGKDGVVLQFSADDKLLWRLPVSGEPRWASCQPPAYQTDQGVVFLDDATGTPIGEVSGLLSRVAHMTGRRFVVLADNDWDAHVVQLLPVRCGLAQEGSVCDAVFCQTTRLAALQVLEVAWASTGWAPPHEPTRCMALAQMLSLRRFCRMRGVDDVGMASELVEPFGRAVLMFV